MNDSSVLHRRTTWADAQMAIGLSLLSAFGEWEDDEHSSLRMVCPACGMVEALQLQPENNGGIRRQCLSGCKLGAIDAALLDTLGLRIKPLKPLKPRGQTLQAAPLEYLHASAEGDARRVIEAFGSRLLLVARTGEYSAPYVLDVDTGIWSGSPDDFLALHFETAKTAALVATDRLFAGEISAALDTEFRRWVKRALSPAGVRNASQSLRGTYDVMINEGKTPAIGGLCRDLDLNRDKRYFGAANGVVDLDTGELLAPDVGAHHWVTRATDVEYRPEAGDSAIDALLAHLDAEEREYLLDAAAYTLRGNPARRWYLLVGPAGSGKTTFLRAIGAALGNASAGGYAFGMASGALLSDKNQNANAHTEHLKHFQDGRFAYSSELADNGARFNEGLIKVLTGGDDLDIRAAHQNSGPSRPATATIFQAVNPKDLARLSLLDTALAERTAILHWPPFPPNIVKDAGRVNAVTEPQAGRAMLAELVRRVQVLSAPPRMPETVASAVEEKRRESLGALGAWLSERVVITGDARNDYVMPDALWTAAYAELEGAEDKIGQYDRRGMTTLLREVLPGLPNQKTRRVDGKVRNAYIGVKLLTAEELRAGSAPICVDCEYYPATPDSERCEDCAMNPIEHRRAGAFRLLAGETMPASWQEYFALLNSRTPAQRAEASRHTEGCKRCGMREWYVNTEGETVRYFEGDYCPSCQRIINTPIEALWEPIGQIDDCLGLPDDGGCRDAYAGRLDAGGMCLACFIRWQTFDVQGIELRRVIVQSDHTPPGPEQGRLIDLNGTGGE